MNAAERPLEERRVIEVLTKEKVPAYQAQLKEALGREIPMTVDVASFPSGTVAFDFLESRGLAGVVSGLPKVAVDRLGKEALEAKISAIRFVYNPKIETVDQALSIKDKILTVSFYWDGPLMLDGDLIAEQLVKML